MTSSTKQQIPVLYLAIQPGYYQSLLSVMGCWIRLLDCLLQVTWTSGQGLVFKTYILLFSLLYRFCTKVEFQRQFLFLISQPVFSLHTFCPGTYRIILGQAESLRRNVSVSTHDSVVPRRGLWGWHRDLFGVGATPCVWMCMEWQSDRKQASSVLLFNSYDW